ncbi:N-glycosylation protein-domain-containing protein [Dactylonectria macrodidyma]|uniref:N-glycosylation protein-domain-containing protein n=1 Tax=Dactylonectria macrodidyma TaxID=307937 RepID=A0A9P9FSH5_9HYPO|nr:N-glycosylation protein-domain-containing protein [Dactylonectria macrodidyma]
MANPSPHRRGSSTGHPLPPPPPPPPQLASHTLPPAHALVHTNSASASVPLVATASSSSVHPSLLQPRVAVVLNVPPPWHPWLFALRLVSVLPAVWWGLPSALQLLLRVLPGPELVIVVGTGQAALSLDADARYALTETGLATIWCFASGYLSFFFTDCLMSRWLINYTPQATMVRLLTINAINAYITANVLSIAGGFQDPRLLLPGWIGIATTLTVLYHITHQKINIRKETSTSMNVFSIASFISMVTLLAHMHSHIPGYPQIPLIASSRRAWDEASRVVAQVRGGPEHDDL